MAKKKAIELILFDGSMIDFIKLMGIGEKNSIYLKKIRGTSIKKLWWEDKDKWFCNIGECKTTDISTSDVPWIISKELENRIKYYINQEQLSMYIDKNMMI